MRTLVTKHMTESAQTHKEGNDGRTMHAIVAASTEVGVVFPSLLRKNLEAAGFKVEAEGKKYGVAVKVFGPLGTLRKAGHRSAVEVYECKTRDPERQPPPDDLPVMVAQGYSNTEADALLHAIHAEMKEEDAVTKATAPNAVTESGEPKKRTKS